MDDKLAKECLTALEGTEANLEDINDLVSTIFVRSKRNVFLSQEIQLRISVLRNSIQDVVGKIKKLTPALGVNTGTIPTGGVSVEKNTRSD